MASTLPRSWGPFAPTKGSAAFTATPIATPDTERNNHFELKSRQDDATSSDRSTSVDSNATLVDDAELSSSKGSVTASKAPLTPPADAVPPSIDGSSRGIVAVKGDDQWQWAMTDRELYHRLQNISDNPSALTLARRRILAEIGALLSSATKLQDDPLHIFSLGPHFDEAGLRDFLQRQHDVTTKRFAAYDERRAEAARQTKARGLKHSDAKRQGMEMFFGDREGAKRWMRRASVVKYVDGAWLQHLLRTTTGAGSDGLAAHEHQNDTFREAAWFKEQRKAARDSWQVMSEELGDGDLTRSHVAIYEKNMDDLAKEDGLPLPPKGEERAFTEWVGAAGAKSTSSPGRDTTGNDRCWRAALAQLALSVSPNEFLPEAIGWNASYEGLPYHLLVSSRELQELDLDAYYFWLHVSIDNASTGHAAMARECIVNFVEGARQARGDEYADEMWARIKLGFALADFIPTTPLLHEDDVDDTPYALTWTSITRQDVDNGEDSSPYTNEHWRKQLVGVFESKAATAHGLHVGVKARIAGESLSYWLDPAYVTERAPDLLDALAANPVWIVAGRPNDSKFVKEFEWGGKMFGAMTGSEVGILRKWVETLTPTPSSEGSVDDSNATVDLLSDDAVEKPRIQTIVDWLSTQSSGAVEQEKTFRDAVFLRPFELPASASSMHMEKMTWQQWSQSSSRELYSAVLARPDCVRPKPPSFDKLLKQLACLGDTSNHQLLSESSQGGLATKLGNVDSLPTINTSAQIDRLLPVFLNTTAPLEQIVSISPSRLASPLGMSVIKILRVLHGFTEISDPQEQLKEGGDGRETGCMGTEDIENDGGGLWEVLQDLHVTQQQMPSSALLDAIVSLESFTTRPGNQLSLPSLLLTLSSHFWEYAPVSLGVVLALCSLLAQPDCIVSLAEAAYRVQQARKGNHTAAKERREEALDAHTDRIASMLKFAMLWTERAIQIGLEHEQKDSLPRGVAGHRRWSADVQWGWRLANQGVREALRT